MPTKLSIVSHLIEDAIKVSGARNAKAVVTTALREFIARRRRKRLLNFVGKLGWDASYEYMAERTRN